MKRKIRYGMVGGGQGSFIGAVHRVAAALDGQMELVCGAFSSDPHRSKQSGLELYLPEERCYGSFEEMFEFEARLSEDKRMDVVTVVTPNHLHFDACMKAMSHGFHVVRDKPLCLTVEEAVQLVSKTKETGLLFAVTYTYSGYPMIRQARQMVAEGRIGIVRKVVIEYSQGWLSQPIEKENQKQAKWRTDPSLSGAAGAMGDIGTHAAHLAEFVSGLAITEICADLHAHIQDRVLDDDGSVLLRFENGARGTLLASQILTGEENNLRLRIYGDKAGLDWSQLEPNTLTLLPLDMPAVVFRTGGPGLSEQANKHTRLPAGHPEGFIGAFANIYRNVASALQSRMMNIASDGDQDFPGIEDGLRGMQFIEAVVKSGKQDTTKWINLDNVK